ncbi:MAG: hypothetical protein AAFQ43_04675 [Bacteroidota bacterium]
MKHLLYRALLAVTLLLASTSVARAIPDICNCVWLQNGCLFVAEVDPNPAGQTAAVYYTCDGLNWYLQGEGPYGGCPGDYQCDIYYA